MFALPRGGRTVLGVASSLQAAHLGTLCWLIMASAGLWEERGGGRKEREKHSRVKEDSPGTGNMPDANPSP